MNTERYLTVLLAACCVAAAGLSATTLESTLSKDPDDVVDLEYEQLPIGQGDAGDINNEVKANKGSGQGPADSNSGDRESQETQKRQSGGGKQKQQSGPGRGLYRSLLDRLLDLLPLFVALVALALAYRYRDRLLALAAATWGLLVPDGDSDRKPRTERWPTGQPANAVREAWLSMVERLDLDRPQARTPAECADAAVDADMNPDAVETLTDVFEEVRYADEPVTDDRIERAREGLRRLDADTSRGGPT